MNQKGATSAPTPGSAAPDWDHDYPALKAAVCKALGRGIWEVELFSVNSRRKLADELAATDSHAHETLIEYLRRGD